MFACGGSFLFRFVGCWPGLAPAGDWLSCARKKVSKEGVLRSFCIHTPDTRGVAGLREANCGESGGGEGEG